MINLNPVAVTTEQKEHEEDYSSESVPSQDLSVFFIQYSISSVSRPQSWGFVYRSEETAIQTPKGKKSRG